METFNSLFMVSPLLLGSSLFVAMLAGFIDSIAGGGGLLTIPALMAAGMSPANALATNKLQACGGSISATIYFIRRKVVSLSDQKTQYRHDLCRLNERRATGAVCSGRCLTADFAYSGDLYRPLFLADAKAG